MDISSPYWNNFIRRNISIPVSIYKQAIGIDYVYFICGYSI